MIDSTHIVAAVLALTGPPSLAWFMVHLVSLYTATERKLWADQLARLEALEALKNDVSRVTGWHELNAPEVKALRSEHDEQLESLREALENFGEHVDKNDAELKRLNEQLTTLSERFYQR